MQLGLLGIELVLALRKILCKGYKEDWDAVREDASLEAWTELELIVTFGLNN
jgi:hypothetical protein